MPLLVDKGYREITLLGQNVNSYGKDRPEWSTLFHDLLYRLDAIPNLSRIRFLTSHPVDISKELMEAIRDFLLSANSSIFPFRQALTAFCIRCIASTPVKNMKKRWLSFEK